MDIYGRYALRHLPELVGLAIAVWIQFQLAYWVTRPEWARRSRAIRGAAWGMASVIAVACVFAAISHFPVISRAIPRWPGLQWVRGMALGWAMASLVASVLIVMWRRIPEFSPQRRGFIRAAGAAVAVTGAVVATGVGLTGKAIGAGIDALSGPAESTDHSGIVVRERIRPADAASPPRCAPTAGDAPAPADCR